MGILSSKKAKIATIATSALLVTVIPTSIFAFSSKNENKIDSTSSLIEVESVDSTIDIGETVDTTNEVDDEIASVLGISTTTTDKYVVTSTDAVTEAVTELKSTTTKSTKNTTATTINNKDSKDNKEETTVTTVAKEDKKQAASLTTVATTATTVGKDNAAPKESAVPKVTTVAETKSNSNNNNLVANTPVATTVAVTEAPTTVATTAATPVATTVATTVVETTLVTEAPTTVIETTTDNLGGRRIGYTVDNSGYEDYSNWEYEDYNNWEYEDSSSSPTSNMTFVKNFSRGTYYCYGCAKKGGSGRALIECSTSGDIKGSIASSYLYRNYGYNYSGSRTTVYLEISGYPEMNGYYYLDDSDAGNSNVIDFYYVYASNCPFRQQGVVSVDCWIVD